MTQDHAESSADFENSNPYRNSRSDHRLSGRLRIVLIVGGTLGFTLLVIAFYLSPDPNGFGTHQKLGFPPCTFIQLFEIPCPSCGMTTAWANLVKGNLYQAFRSNAGGALLGLSTLLLAPWMLVSGMIGRWWISPPDMVSGFFILLGITLVTLIQWAIWVMFFPI